MNLRTMMTLVTASAIAAGCGAGLPDTEETLGEVAESYVRLVLAVGEHDDGYVDAYYGPEAWPAEVAAEGASLEEIRERARDLIDRLDEVDVSRHEELVRLRHRYLTRQLQALIARTHMLEGATITFDQESEALYDAVAPRHHETQFAVVLARLEERLPGDGPLVERLDAFRSDFVIPTERLDTVFRAAIDEARRRTRERIRLPENESFVFEFVKDKPWSGYNWYQGAGRSLIQVNTDLPITIDRAIDLAVHEGYPGHHVYNVLLEDRLVRGRGWVEYSVYPLYSPQSLIAEGSANFGIEVAFPGEERLAFERDVLFPLAGLDPDRVEEYYEVQALVAELGYAGNEAARRYLNGEIEGEEAAEWLARYALMPIERARQRVRFFDAYRSYVINYNLGQDLVRLAGRVVSGVLDVFPDRAVVATEAGVDGVQRFVQRAVRIGVDVLLQVFVVELEAGTTCALDHPHQRYVSECPVFVASAHI